MTDQLTQEDANELVASTFVRESHFFEQTESTNDEALAVAESLSQLPSLFLTASQTAGRGRGANRWVSTAGALTFSLVIRPLDWRVEPACWPQLSLWTALGIRDAIAQYAPQHDVQVKWPNDVFASQRKICGILVESVVSTDPKSTRLVVGVGVNVNNAIPQLSKGDQDSSLTANAVALGQLINAPLKLVDVAQTVLNSIDDAWGLFATDESLHQAWQPHCLLTGRTIQWQGGQQTKAGICQGIGDDGALLLDTATGGTQKCYGGTILS